ncbi:hypothetical protein Noda2021_01380 [Candidatus Dependentiae bacterium Noda2021]|nr:hypothetical protein Noda2021_01380 [Candidatus Dependentiae bacterium Noda2021]
MKYLIVLSGALLGSGLKASQNNQFPAYKKPTFVLHVTNSTPKKLRIGYQDTNLEKLNLDIKQGQSKKILLNSQKTASTSKSRPSLTGWSGTVLFYDDKIKSSNKEVACLKYSSETEYATDLHKFRSVLARQVKIQYVSFQEELDLYEYQNNIQKNIQNEEHIIHLFLQGNNLEHSTLDVLGSIS